MNPWGVTIVGIIMLISIAWQIGVLMSIFEGAGAPIIFGPPSALGAAVILGELLYSIFTWLDGQTSDFGPLQIMYNVGKAVLFSIILVIKVFIGPMILGKNASYSVYNYFQHNIIEIWPVMRWIVGLIFENAPDPIVLVYTIGFSIFSMVCAGFALNEING